VDFPVAKTKESINPFYVALVVVGVVFFVTAFAYGAMTYLAIQPAAAREVGRHELWNFMDVHGIELMGLELGVLAAATFGAMWLDGYRLRQKKAESAHRPGDATEAESGREIG
jgi:hypothetical protein